ncbi:MAG: hypothetical protein ACI843_001200 [Psychrobacter glaciei]|jgi:hypothetical protein
MKSVIFIAIKFPYLGNCEYKRRVHLKYDNYITADKIDAKLGNILIKNNNLDEKKPA